jgi:Icc-related predicted phosphoesterase
MSLKILGFGDPHIQHPTTVDTAAELSEQQKEDIFSSEPLRHWLSDLDEKERPDLIMTVGDIIDRVPSKRDNEREAIRDIELAQEVFLDEIEELCEEYGMAGVGVGGNHDADIHSEMFSGYRHVHDLNFSVTGTDELGLEEEYSLVGIGATEFDIGPEVSYRNYGSLESGEKFLENTDERRWQDREFRGTYHNGSVPHLEVLENNLNHLAHTGNDPKVIGDILGINPDERRMFNEEVSEYIDRYEKAAELMEEAASSDGEMIYINHNAPFNTSLDSRQINSDTVYDGSIVDKNILREFQPGLNVSGHTHNGGADYIGETYGERDSATALNLRPGEVVEIEIDQKGRVSYSILG